MRSEPRRSAAEAVADIAAGRAAVRAAGGMPMAVGLHPTAAFGDVRLVDSDRYRRVEGEMRGLIKRTPECALHVHVAMPSPDAAVDGLMGLREALPLIGALGAGSPFWFGVDSGLASARSAVDPRLPGARRASAAARLGGLPGDARAGSRSVAVLAITRWCGGTPACSRGWARSSCASSTSRPAWRRRPEWRRWSTRWRGGRPRAHGARWRRPRRCTGRASARCSDGLDAELLFEGRLRPVRAAARELLDELRGEDDALDGVERILREGGAPARQRAIHAEGGMPALLRYLAEKTAR